MQSTQAGRVATPLHVGPYDRLSEAHVAIQKWCAENGYVPAGVDWDVYGDWNDDPAKLETRVFYLLR
jgi:effector-binding domain-containing protein